MNHRSLKANRIATCRGLGGIRWLLFFAAAMPRAEASGGLALGPLEELRGSGKPAVEEPRRQLARAGAEAAPSNRPFLHPPAAGRPGPPFSLRRTKEEWWLHAPDGRRWFSFGVCCVNQGTSRGEYSADNPSYAAWQHYHSPTAWAEATLERLRSWSFNTVGGWSDFVALRQATNLDFALTPVLACGMTAGAPWWDMWSAKVLRRMEQTARRQILPLRRDPRLLGYYTDNEMGWWNAALWKMTLEDKPTSGARRRLVKLLRSRYHDDWPAVLRDFDPEGAASFADLARGGMLYLRPGRDGIRVVREFLGLMAERYYSVARRIVRTYDQRGLILGDRYQSFYYLEVVRAAAPHVDAISSNLNASWNDGSFARFYLDTLHALCRRPVFIGEFYLAAMENRTGNPNDSSNFPTVQTQRERAEGFARTLTELARLPYVVGADWFQFYDEPPKGRADGENYNMGLVDVSNQPYEDLTARAAALDLLRLKSAPPEPRPDARGGVPRAQRDPLADFESQTALKHWDRERGFVPPASAFPVADLYVCWEPEALYLGLYAHDPVEPEYYRDGQIPETDRAAWTVRVGDRSEPIRVRLGAGRAPTGAPADVTVTNLSGLRQTVRNIAALRIPAARLDRRRLEPGQTVAFGATLLTHARAYRVEWAGEFRLTQASSPSVSPPPPP